MPDKVSFGYGFPCDGPLDAEHRGMDNLLLALEASGIGYRQWLRMYDRWAQAALVPFIMWWLLDSQAVLGRRLLRPREGCLLDGCSR